MRNVRLSALLTLILGFTAICGAEDHEVVVYGGTSGGVIAAVQAGRMGKGVALIEPSRHLGGMTAGGLGATDTGNQKAIGGVAREFYQRVLRYYQDKSVWKYETPEQYAKRERYYQGDALFGFEPHVAEKIYNDMLGESHVTIVLGERLDLKNGVTRDGANGIPWGPRGMPNRKTDTNNSGGFSTDFIGMAHAYPEADYATRERITADHVRYDQGLLWTLANHPRIPAKVREAVSKWGLARDEFADNGNWPYQLYVRESRRMVSDYVVTEQDTKWDRKCEDPVGLGSYNMDSHHCQRYVDSAGHVRNEGDVQVGVAGPYGISYRSLVPKLSECTNLLVPVCMSASHAGYGSVRMEPVYMILGQTCGTAAAMAIDANADVQKIPYSKLRQRLIADKQLVEWTGPGVRRGLSASKLPGIVMDDKQAVLTGDWVTSSAAGGIDGSYQHDGNAGKGHKSARFELKIPRDGRYEVRFAFTPNPNRATNVPVTIEAADGDKTVSVNERIDPPIDKSFVSLGTFNFSASRPAVIIVKNAGTDGFVIVDAVQLLP